MPRFPYEEKYVIHKGPRLISGIDSHVAHDVEGMIKDDITRTLRTINVTLNP